MRIRKYAADILVWAIFFVLLAVCFTGASTLGRYSSISLRYGSPIDGRAAYAARLYSAAHSGEGVFWPTFWSEGRASLKGGFMTVEAKRIAFSGDASLVLPASYVTGTAPGLLDDSGCAVSEALAWRLWGNTDVVGMSVEVDGEERVVRGVFEGQEELALISYRDEYAAGSWYAVELSGGPENPARLDAEGFAIASGLGKPDHILMGGESALAGALVLLPVAIPVLYCLGRAIGFFRRRYPSARWFAPFSILFVFAAFLPTVLNTLPGWMIPTRWSDLSFWGDMFKEAVRNMREFLSVTPQSRDVELRLLLIKQAGAAFIAVCFSLGVCFISAPQAHYRKQNKRPPHRF